MAYNDMEITVKRSKYSLEGVMIYKLIILYFALIQRGA